MKVLSSSARLDIFGLSLTVALAAACSFDTSQLGPPVSRSSDGAVEYPAVPDVGAFESGGTIASPPDAPTAAGGSGGTITSPPDAPTATGGSGGTITNPSDAPTAAGGTGGAIASPPDAPTAPGGTSRTGGTGAGGTTASSTYGSGGATSPFGGTTATGGAATGGVGSGGKNTGGVGTGGAVTTGGTGGSGGKGGTAGSTSTAPPPTGLDVYLTKATAGSTNGQISLFLRIENQGSAAADISTVTLRYWYQAEAWDTSTLTLAVDYMGPSGDTVTGAKAVAVSPSMAGADHYLELSFSGTIPAKGRLETNLRPHNSNWQGTVDVTNDYSYNAGAAGLNDKMTLYGGGKLIWGTEP